jgi:predicted dehydrogenase
VSRPRIGFLGVGWIGRHRMEAMIASELIEAAAICDPSREMIEQAAVLAPSAVHTASLDEMLGLRLDGVVIATPSAAHAGQAIRCLEAGETRAVIDAAGRADRLLAVDLSYRFTNGMKCIAELIGRGELGRIFAVDLVFHNAYGPDKPWFYDRALSGGGCVIDLGIHLIDLAVWAIGDTGAAGEISASLFKDGRRLPAKTTEVEDYAVASLTLAGGTALRLACSWRLNAGQDAEIAAVFYGTQGGAAFRNVAGSFYDFIAEKLVGTHRETIASPPDEWGGRAAVDWARQLSDGKRFDAEVRSLVLVADIIEQIYRASHGCLGADIDPEPRASLEEKSLRKPLPCPSPASHQ